MHPCFSIRIKWSERRRDRRKLFSRIVEGHRLGSGKRRQLIQAETRCPSECPFLVRRRQRRGTGSILDRDKVLAKGHRLNSRQRESSINQLLTAESWLLWCSQVEENARTCALFSRFLRRWRKTPTRWRRGGDSNPRDPFESTRVPGVRLKPGSATSPRANGDYASRTAAGPVRLLAGPHYRIRLDSA
jgi:hypothetical protein